MSNFKAIYSKLEEQAKSIEASMNLKNAPERAKIVLVGQAYPALAIAYKGNFKIAEEMLNSTQNFISAYIK